MYWLKVVCIMSRDPSDSATARQAAYRIQLTAALLLVCRKIRRLQTSPEAQAACDDIARELRALVTSFKRRGKAHLPIVAESGGSPKVAQASRPARSTTGRYLRRYPSKH